MLCKERRKAEEGTEGEPVHRVVREELGEKMTLEQVLERHEGTGLEDTWVRSISARWKARAKP